MKYNLIASAVVALMLTSCAGISRNPMITLMSWWISLPALLMMILREEEQGQATTLWLQPILGGSSKKQNWIPLPATVCNGSCKCLC